MILLLVLIIGMLGGLGALAWSQRTVLSDLLASFDTVRSRPPPKCRHRASRRRRADSSGKDTDRLLPGAVATGPANEVRSVTPQADTGKASPARQLTPLPPRPAPAGPRSASAAPAADADGARGAARRPLRGAARPGFGGKRRGGDQRRGDVDATVANGTDGPEIVANLDVPERGMKIKVTIRQERRHDAAGKPSSSRSWSTTPPNFPGKGVKDVPRLVMKPTEEARGQPLIGASAKVADGFFWIALSGGRSRRRDQRRADAGAGWIDLPLVYDTGQRAILTFEKGTPGERVFEKALAAWLPGIAVPAPDARLAADSGLASPAMLPAVPRGAPVTELRWPSKAEPFEPDPGHAGEGTEAHLRQFRHAMGLIASRRTVVARFA